MKFIWSAFLSLLFLPCPVGAETTVHPVITRIAGVRLFPSFGVGRILNRNTGKRLSTKTAPLYVHREIADGTLVFSGVTHPVQRDGKAVDVHGYAEIPLHKAKEMILHLEHFPPELLAAHTQIHVTFPKGSIKWYASEDDLDRGIVGDRLSDLVLSVEAWWVEGDTFGLFRGRKFHYTIAFRGVSLENKIQAMIRDQDHTVEQWKLKATPDQIEQYIRDYAECSRRSSGVDPYDTIKMNCTTEHFELLQPVLGKRIRSPFFPVRSVPPLKRAGVLEGRIEDLADR